MIEQSGRRALVFVRGVLAGEIREEDVGFVFEYAATWLENPEATVVSLTLPLRAEPYRSTVLFPFFDGLLPEGWMLDLAIRNWKLNPRDRFGILLHACRDCIGNVSVQGVEA